MRLSVIIVNYNTFELTCKCIESVLKHTSLSDYEIILVDNDSSECPPQLFQERFPEIELIVSPENVGFAKGNNLGIAKARGEYILLLNSDIELVEDAIVPLLDYMQHNPSVGVVSPMLIYPDGQLQHVAGRFPGLRYELIELFRLHKLLGGGALLGWYFDHRRLVEADWVWGAFFLMRRQVLESFPRRRLPDDFFMYFEDVQWCYHIKKAGYKVVYNPIVKAVHHVSASSKEHGVSMHKLQLSLNNEYIFWKKERGEWYARLLMGVRALKYLSLRQPHFLALARVYGRVFWQGLPHDE
ncbi:glycosyltransferase family 2 protein [Thermonema rossianum]|uniref:glycosyltransferase family 2 protein n=1 Tax=Thermonema rossianum TaxID=55505 RepID=UPI000691E1FE|nr:glycosyltransferase family 2 protein [Thermonema rossianum]